MNNAMEIDPLSSYEATYDYPLQNQQYYPHLPHPNLYPYKDQSYQPPNYPQQLQYLQEPPQIPEELNTVTDTQATEDSVETKIEIDIKPIIEAQPEEKVQDGNDKKKTYKRKGKTSDYWNKKIMDKDFAFYGCSVCNIAYKDLAELDQHVIIHSNRMTSYDLRIQNLKKRKLLKKEKKNKKKVKKDSKNQVDNIDIEIKPEDGYIGTEKAAEYDQTIKVEDKNEGKSVETSKENNENAPANAKSSDKNYINVYKCFGCNKQFALSYYLRIHVRSHTDEKPYTCNICGQTFITASKMGRHKKRVHLAVRHQCRICFKIYNRFELLVKHFDQKHAEDKLEGEPYDYNEILPYLKELEEQLKEEKEVTKTEDSGDKSQTEEQQPKVEGLLADTKHEGLDIKEEDKVTIPINIEFYDETKEELVVLPTANVNVEVSEINFIKEEAKAASDEECGDDFVMEDVAAADDDDDKISDGDDKFKDETMSGSDEEYFPSDIWARSPPELPVTPSTDQVVRPKAKTTTCHICNKKLSSKGYLRVHMRVHTGEKPFSCYVCGRGFITANKMHRHVLRHDETWEEKVAEKTDGSLDNISKEIPITTDISNEDVKIKSEPEMEEIENDKKKKKKKKKIKKKSNINKVKSKLLAETKKSFFEKKKSKHVKWEHVCDYCNQRFLHLETLEVHIKAHADEEKVFKCHFCLEPQIDKSVKEHEATHTGPKPFLCTLCGNVYKKKGAMVLHRKTRCKQDSADKMYVCDICSKRYNSHTKLQRHLVSHSVNKFTLRYECPVCAHMFHTRYHVQMHLKSHMKEGLILEENRNAVLAMVLQNARKIPKTNDGVSPTVTEAVPSDERSRICNICGQIFNHFYYLEEHLKTHGSKIAIQDLDKEEEKKYTCQVCSKSFKLHYYLKLHSYTHTKEKPHICQQCGKGFITKGKLKRHLETHQGLKKYQCHICYKFFTRPSYLRIHVRTIHGTQDYNFGGYGIGVPIGTISNNSV